MKVRVISLFIFWSLYEQSKHNQSYTFFLFNYTFNFKQYNSKCLSVSYWSASHELKPTGAFTILPKLFKTLKHAIFNKILNKFKIPKQQ